MKRHVTLALAALLGTVGAATVAEAHHSFSMFDHTQEVVIEGEVNRWAFNSPHALLFVKDADGTQFVFEGSAPPSLITKTPGMTGTTFSEGEKVTVVFCPLKDGRNGGGIGIVIAEDGTVFDPSDGGCHAERRMTEWPEWIKAGYRNLEEVEAGTGATIEN